MMKTKNKLIADRLSYRSDLIVFDEETHVYKVDDEPYIPATTLINILEEDKSFEELKKDPIMAATLKKKADLGTRVHKAIEEFYLTGKHPEEMEISDVPFYENFIEFNNSEWRKGLKLLSTEQRLYVKYGNIRIAGTADLLFEDKNGNIIVADIKNTYSKSQRHFYQGLLYGWMIKTGGKLNYIPSSYFIYLGLGGRGEMKWEIIKSQYQNENVLKFYEKLQTWIKLKNRK